MSAGIIWYKIQPHSSIAAAVSDLLTNYCGSIKSHDTTVRAQNIGPLLREILSRSDHAVIVGGLDCPRQEENIIFILSRALGIPLETGYLSRSRFCFDKLRGVRLPSLAGSVLFPVRRGGPEGVLLMAGKQSILLLPSHPRAAVSAAVAMREFLAPLVSERQRNAVTLPTVNEPVPKEYAKFKRHSQRQFITREYSEEELRDRMERSAAQKAGRSEEPDDYRYDDSNRYNPRQASTYPADSGFYRRRKSSRR